MNKFRFKSLTTKVWLSTIVIVIAIVLCVNLFYTFVFREAQTQTMVEALWLEHEMIMEHNFDVSLQFTDIRDLQGIIHFLYIDGVVYTLYDRENPRDLECEVTNIILGFISYCQDTQLFSRRFLGEDYVFVASAVDYYQNIFFISYMPNPPDSRIIYFMFAIGALFIVVSFFSSLVTKSRSQSR